MQIYKLAHNKRLDGFDVLQFKTMLLYDRTILISVKWPLIACWNLSLYDLSKSWISCLGNNNNNNNNNNDQAKKLNPATSIAIDVEKGKEITFDIEKLFVAKLIS